MNVTRTNGWALGGPRGPMTMALSYQTIWIRSCSRRTQQGHAEPEMMKYTRAATSYASTGLLSSFRSLSPSPSS